MSSLAGWLGSVAEGDGILRQMAHVMCGPRPAVALHLGDDFAVAITQPAVAGDIQRVAGSEDGRVTLAFAGYLFTEDDHERAAPARHCLQLYRQHGPAFAGLLNGSFAIVVRDSEASQLHLIRDHMGTRPLYYRAGSPFLFGSEVKAILEFPGVSREIDPAALTRFLLDGRVFGPDTYYPQIKRAPEASVTTWDGTRVTSTRYWKPPFGAEKCPDLLENAHRAQEALRNATGRACAGAERPALMLSGGLDSRALASACPAQLRCLTMHSHPGHEVRVARRVARALGHKHQFVPLAESHPLALVTVGSLAGDGMYAFEHAQALLLADVLGEQGTDALLIGQVVEATLSNALLPQRQPRVLGVACGTPRLAPLEGRDLISSMVRARPREDSPRVRGLIGDDRAKEAIGQTDRLLSETVSALDGRVDDPYLLHCFALIADLSCTPYSLNTLAIERVVPGRRVGADREVVELFFSLPPEHRVAHRLYTALFTRLDRRCRWVPYSNTGLPLLSWPAPEYLCAQLQHRGAWELYRAVRRVSGAWADHFDRGAWPRARVSVRYCPEWHDYLRRRVRTSRLVDLGLLSGGGLRSLVEDQIADRDNNWSLLSKWITLEEWLAHYG